MWAAPTSARPLAVDGWTLHVADTEATALEAVGRLAERAVELDAVVAAPDLPDGDGGRVLRAVRERWSDAACFLHGDLWAIPTGSELPVCEFHPDSQSVADVVDAVSEAVHRRSHRPYPVHEDEGRRLAVLERVDVADARPALEAVLEDASADLGADLSLFSLVGDRTVRIVAASDGTEYEPLRRGDSPCAYALCEPSATVVPDLSADERLAHSAEAYPEGVRSFAGRPVWVEGVPVGVVSALADEPGAFPEVHEETLSTQARSVERLLAVGP